MKALTKVQAIEMFQDETGCKGDIVHEEFIITDDTYSYSQHTQLHTYTYMIQVSNRQVVLDVYNKINENIDIEYHNVTRPVVRLLLEMFNELKVSKLGY